ncbi:hypothetical protein ACEPAG_159 [Sanghuangporus baumii]
MLTRTASALQAEGWIVPTGPLPRAIAGFWGIDLLGPNVYLPSSHLMAKSIARTYDRHGEKCTGFALLLRAWASYFYLYCDFHAESLDDAEQEVRDFWRSISTT